jgi:hypothetical protein
MLVAVAALAAGCASSKPASARIGAEGARATSHRFVDDDLGFAIERPDGEAWQFTQGSSAPDGIVVPVVVLHEDSGAQVVVQVAPGIASSEEFAGRLAMGLQSKPGFRIGGLTETPDGGAGFEFALSDLVEGRVRVHEGTSGQVFEFTFSALPIILGRCLFTVGLVCLQQVIHCSGYFVCCRHNCLLRPKPRTHRSIVGAKR